jgi:type VI secretion system protein ImpL
MTVCATSERMVALLEATMWRQIRDPEYLLGALKV